MYKTFNNQPNTGFTQLVKRGIVVLARHTVCAIQNSMQKLCDSVFTPHRTTLRAMPRNTTGFTLIEMLVSFSLFTIIMMVSIGALLSIANATRYGNSVRSVMDNVSYALDVISRTMRTGSDYTCYPGAYDGSQNVVPITGGRDCSTGGFAVAFYDQYGSPIAYQVNPSSGTLEVKKGQCANSICTYAASLPMTSPYVSIKNTGGVAFYVQGTTSTSDQPRMLINISGEAGSRADLKANFNIETTVSQRSLDR